MHLLAKCIFIFQLLILFVNTSQALVCFPCSMGSCQPPKDCKGGLVPGQCGCCHVCAKQKNESCGGFSNVYGTCDQGLQCVVPPPVILPNVTFNNFTFISFSSSGVCEGLYGTQQHNAHCVN